MNFQGPSFGSKMVVSPRKPISASSAAISPPVSCQPGMPHFVMAWCSWKVNLTQVEPGRVPGDAEGKNHFPGRVSQRVANASRYADITLVMFSEKPWFITRKIAIFTSQIKQVPYSRRLSPSNQIFAFPTCSILQIGQSRRRM